MTTYLTLINGLAVSLFGSFLSAFFCGALSAPRNRRIFVACALALPALQGLIVALWSTDLLRQIYPLVIHLPLVLILYYLTKRLLWSAVSVLTAYLCCQLRRWVVLLVVALSSGGTMLQDIVEVIITIPLLLLLLHFVAPAIRRLSGRATNLQYRFGAIPALYYVFDYASVVYTDFLKSGVPVVVEFMPFVCCGSYLLFLLYHSETEQTENQLQQAKKSLDFQLKQSVREIHALRESQALARRYRHDLRHHLQYVSACIENGQSDQAQTYISSICQEIEAQKVRRFCENEAANLILSSFAGRAEKDGITLNVQGTLPAFILVSDSDLCVILSNALENAIHACGPLVLGGVACTIDVLFYMRENKLFLQITNPCAEEPSFVNGIPVSNQPDHGIGVQSICAIVQQYKGVCSFLAQNGQFILRLSI